MKGVDDMAFDYSRLDGRITEVCKTRAAFAAAMGTSEHTISNKMNGKIKGGWTQPEIDKACQVLGIAHADIPSYFFVRQVQFD